MTTHAIKTLPASPQWYKNGTFISRKTHPQSKGLLIRVSLVRAQVEESRYIRPATMQAFFIF